MENVQHLTFYRKIFFLKNHASSSSQSLFLDRNRMMGIDLRGGANFQHSTAKSDRSHSALYLCVIDILMCFFDVGGSTPRRLIAGKLLLPHTEKKRWMRQTIFQRHFFSSYCHNSTLLYSSRFYSILFSFVSLPFHSHPSFLGSVA